MGSVRKAASVRLDPMNHYHVPQVTTVKKINWTRNLGLVQLVTSAMEAQSTATLLINLMVTDVQRATIVLSKVPIQRHAHLALTLTQNITSSETIVNLAFLVCSAQLMDLTIHLVIALKDFTVLKEKHSKVLQTKNVSLVISVPRVVDFTILVLPASTSHMPDKAFVISVLLEAIAILTKRDRTCHAKGMSLVEL